MPTTVDLDNVLEQLNNKFLDCCKLDPTLGEIDMRTGMDFAVKLIEAALELEQGYKNKPVHTKNGEPVSLPYQPVMTLDRRLLLIPWNTVFTNTNPVCYEEEWYEGFYVTYQEKDSSISTSDTTRLVLGNLQKVFTLHGDHSKELMKAAQEGGFEACLEYVQAKLAEEEADSPQLLWLVRTRSV